LSATVLIAEDDTFVRVVIADFLRDAGYQVIEARNADEAIATLQSGTAVDLLFTDVRMPGSMDGCGLAKVVRAQWPDTRIILTSGYSSALLSAQNTVDDIVVPKPYRPQHVLTTIEAIVGGKSSSAGRD
jgi:CheY-like chemotaxis protein